MRSLMWNTVGFIGNLVSTQSQLFPLETPGVTCVLHLQLRLTSLSRVFFHPTNFFLFTSFVDSFIFNFFSWPVSFSSFFDFQDNFLTPALPFALKIVLSFQWIPQFSAVQKSLFSRSISDCMKKVMKLKKKTSTGIENFQTTEAQGQDFNYLLQRN